MPRTPTIEFFNKEFENLKNQQKMISNTEEQIGIERKKQIEMLERIWNKLE